MGLIIGLTALAAAIVVGVLAMTSAAPAGDRVARGLADIEAYYGRGGGVAAAVSEDSGELALPPLLDRLRVLGARLSPGILLTSLYRRLDIAGNPPRWSPEKVLAYKGLGLFALALVGFLLGVHSPVTVLVFPLLGGVVGFFLPDLLVYNTGAKRQVVLRKDLPDSLDMLTVCVEAGLGFDAALSHVAHNTSGPLAEEYLRMLQEMQLGKSRVEALRALTERTTVPELRTFASSLVQASELGIPAARVLYEQAKEMRLKRRQLAEEKAQKVPVKILFPLIFCIFPALFVVIMGPAVISILHLMSHKN